MKHFDFKYVLFLCLLAFQLACGQTQTVSNENNNKKNAANTNQANITSVVDETEVQKKEVDYFAHLKPEHKEVLQEWLKKRPYLRPAIEEIDSTLGKSELEDVHKNSRTQFYTIADINKDGKEDFAVLLIDTERKNKFAIAIFNGKFSKGQVPNHFEENLNRISDSHIEYVKEKDSDNYFSSNSFLLLSDKERGCAGFVPKNKVYEAVVCI
jgi:hypothetical protein